MLDRLLLFEVDLAIWSYRWARYSGVSTVQLPLQMEWELDIAVGVPDAPRLTLTDQTNGLPDTPGLHIKLRTEAQMPLHYYPCL